jgi:hypothetical protein
MKKNPIEAWLQDSNPLLCNDIKKVHSTGTPIYVTDYELKGLKNLIINYQVVSLESDECGGVVVMIEHISVEKRSAMTLRRYISPEPAKKFMDEEADRLKGSRTKASILFSNIHFFNALVADMDAQEVIVLLDQHFVDTSRAITDEEGIVHKFTGITTLI